MPWWEALPRFHQKASICCFVNRCGLISSSVIPNSVTSNLTYDVAQRGRRRATSYDVVRRRPASDHVGPRRVTSCDVVRSRASSFDVLRRGTSTCDVRRRRATSNGLVQRCTTCAMSHDIGKRRTTSHNVRTTSDDVIRHLTTSYDVGRRRTDSYDVVRHRTTTYETRRLHFVVLLIAVE